MASRREWEEANRVRAEIGLGPLPPPADDKNVTTGASANGPSPENAENGENGGSTMETRQGMGILNWLKQEDERLEKEKHDEKRKRIKRNIEMAQRNAKLQGKGLGEASSEEEDSYSTMSWIKASKERAKKIEKKRKKALAAEKAKQATAATYSEKDLHGTRVGHDVDDLDEEKEQILTLKDRAVDAESDEGDELENADIRDKEKLREKLDAKKRAAKYKPAEAFDGQKSILSQYDETIDGKQKDSFTLGSTIAPKKRRIEAGDVDEDVIAGRTKVSLNLDVQDRTATSDYQMPKFKKLKGNKNKIIKHRHDSGDERDNGTDNATTIPRKTIEPIPRPALVFKTREEHEAENKARIEADKRRWAEIREMGRRDAEEAASRAQMNDKAEQGLVYGDTARFVESLDDEERLEIVRKRQAIERARAKEAAAIQARRDALNDVPMENAPDPFKSIKDEVDDDEKFLINANGDEEGRTGDGELPFGHEEAVSGSMGAVFSMLKKRGIIDDSEAKIAAESQRSQQEFLAQLRAHKAAVEASTRAEREIDRASGRQDRMSQQEREARNNQRNAQRELQEANAAMKFYEREYRPRIDLKYLDEFGRRMDPHEAFKQMSHQFHGKSSGKAKTEKRLKRIADERAREAKSLTFSSVPAAEAQDAGEGSSKRKNPKHDGMVRIK